MDETIKQELKKALEEEHNLLVSELKSIAKPDAKISGDWDANFPRLEEEQDEVEEYEVRLEAEHSLESRLLEVNKSLERMKTGEYGKCRVCKKEIPLERLRANPAADTHIEHA